jgi:serine protease Do
MESPNAPSFVARSFLERIKSHRLASAFTLLATLTVGILAGSVLTRDVGAAELTRQNDSSGARQIVIPNPVTLSNGFAQIVKMDGPAVVNINTESIPKQAKAPRGHGRITPLPKGADPGDQGDMQDFFNRFFGGQNPGGGDDDDNAPGGGERQALGSGFIVDSRGYIITNNHVVDKADRIFVKLAGEPDDGAGPMQGHPATVIGVDPETDIAVIKIDTKEPLPTVKLGNSDGAEVGDWVLAIGSPFGLSQTVSAGIVSAKDRTIPDEDANGHLNQFQKFIQTDAAINPGNSGGPLVDMTGAVIGMNTAIYTQSMGSQGVGFAMPSNILARVYNDLIGPTHKVVRGSIGITFQGQQSSAVSRMYGFSNGGVIVGSVIPGGGAAKAGLEVGDVLVSIDGRHIKNGDDLVNDISARKVGSSVSIGYLRNGKPMTATVVIGDRAKVYSDLADAAPQAEQPAPPDAGQTKLGVSVSAVPAATASKLGIPGGVAVTSVTPGSFADDIGLGQGEVIVEINKMPVTDMASYNRIVSQLKPGDDVVFVVRFKNQAGNSFIGGTLR